MPGPAASGVGAGLCPPQGTAPVPGGTPLGAEVASSTRQPVVCCQVATQRNVPVSLGNFRLSGNRKLSFITRKTQGEGQRGRTGCP